MFGVTLARPPRPASALSPVRYSDRPLGALLFGLGCASAGFALGALWIFWGSWLALLGVALPLILCALFSLGYGFVGLTTRVELAPDGLRVSAPSWRLIPALPVQRLEVAWADVTAVRHRIEWYGCGLPRLHLSIDVYVIETAAGRVVLGDYFLPQLEAVLTDVADRAGRQWVEDGALELPLLTTVWRGLSTDSR